LRAQGCSVLIISHLLFDQQRFDALYQLQNGVLHTLAISGASAAGSRASAEEVRS
jgi:hypothetical protein